MAEVLGIVTGALGALDVGIRWLKDLNQAVDRYRHAGEKLTDIHDKFEQFEQRLNLWAKMWNVGVYGPATDIRGIWGSKGSSLIRTQLAAIQKQCEDFKRIMANLASPKVLAILRDGNSSRADTLPLNFTKESRELAELVQQALKAKDKAKFALLKAEELASLVTELNTRYTLLDYDSKARWADVHPESAKIACAATQRALLGVEIEGIPLVHPAEGTTLVHLALRTREASKALFQSCTAVNTISIADPPINPSMHVLPKFEMTLLQEDGEISDSENRTLRYHLLVPWPNLEEEVEILIEGPLVSQCASSMGLADHNDFLSACAAISRNELGSLEFRTSLGNALWFRSCQPLIPLQGNPITVLAELLEQTANMTAYDALEVFPSSERLELAFRTVECGLFLLGTPWLSDLRSKRLERVGLPATGLFTLGTGLTANVDDNFVRIGQQIFAVGVLLAEIGTGQPLSENFLMKPGAIPHLLARIPYGLKYANAVEYCLLIHKKNPHIKSARRHGGDFKAALQEVLHDYYMKVHLPIKSLLRFLSTE